MTTPPCLFDPTGRPITLAAPPLGIGGEGTVYNVTGDPNQVAKIYHQLPGPEQVAKLRTTIRLASPTILKVAAWPTEPLYLSPGGPVAGFLMPNIAGFRPIHQLYGTSDRKKYFPEASWDFLIYTAQRCAEVFKTIHTAGHVLGDVNESNVFVSSQGIVQLIDCDSFQVRDATGKVFRCEVGVEQFTPPELQGRSLAAIDRTENHDRFGLAVLIFQLLMMGRHPYAGVYAGPGDLLPGQAISSGRFAYSRSPATTQNKPPPSAPPIRLLDGLLFGLFERAFSLGTTPRPEPQEWDQALATLRRQLEKCSTDPRHIYPRPFGICPWCEFITRIGFHFFAPSPAAAAKVGPSFDFAVVWAQIEAIYVVRFHYTRPAPSRTIIISGKPVPPAGPAHLNSGLFPGFGGGEPIQSVRFLGSQTRKPLVFP